MLYIHGHKINFCCRDRTAAPGRLVLVLAHFPMSINSRDSSAHEIANIGEQHSVRPLRERMLRARRRKIVVLLASLGKKGVGGIVAVASFLLCVLKDLCKKTEFPRTLYFFG